MILIHCSVKTRDDSNFHRKITLEMTHSTVDIQPQSSSLPSLLWGLSVCYIM